MDEHRYTLADPDELGRALKEHEDGARLKAKEAALKRLRLAVDDVFLQSLGQQFGDQAGLGASDAIIQFVAEIVAAETGVGPDVAKRLAEAGRTGMRSEWAKIRNGLS